MAAVSQDIGWEAALNHSGPWTEEDFDRLPEGLRAELHYGRLILTPSPSWNHGNVIRRICGMFDMFVEDPNQVGQQTDVRMADGEVIYCPDFAVLSKPGHGRPIPAEQVVIVGEVISPNGGKEMREKMADYAEAGIPAYLVIAGDEASGHFARYYLLRGDAYELVETTEPGAVLTITEPIQATINLGRL